MIDEKNIKIGIIGLGYVGLPLALEFSKYFYTIGYDKNFKRIRELNNNFDNTLEVSKEELIANGKIKYYTNYKKLSICNIYIVTVPTPVDKNKKPNLSPLEDASSMIGKIINEGNIVVFESTVYPGVTEEFCAPIIQSISGLIFNKNFFCGYSPERINPGDKKHTLKKITKIVSGSNKKVSLFLDSLYKKIIPAGTFLASSIAVAEAAKVIENTQRDVNIALINEFSILFNKLNLDTVEVLEAAETKWNFLPFRPGLVGGHCIGVDPYYLTHKALEVGYKPKMILAGREINDSMGKIIADQVISMLNKKKMNISRPKIGILGFTFKENCPDIRNTGVIKIIDHLKLYNCDIMVTDEFADFEKVESDYQIRLQNLSSMESFNVIIVAVSHSRYTKLEKKEWRKLLKDNGIIIDIKSTLNKDYFSNMNIEHWRL